MLEEIQQSLDGPFSSIASCIHDYRKQLFESVIERCHTYLLDRLIRLNPDKKFNVPVPHQIHWSVSVTMVLNIFVLEQYPKSGTLMIKLLMTDQTIDRVSPTFVTEFPQQKPGILPRLRKTLAKHDTVI
jgi:hypothetical protein